MPTTRNPLDNLGQLSRSFSVYPDISLASTVPRRHLPTHPPIPPRWHTYNNQSTPLTNTKGIQPRQFACSAARIPPGLHARRCDLSWPALVCRCAPRTVSALPLPCNPRVTCPQSYRCHGPLERERVLRVRLQRPSTRRARRASPPRRRPPRDRWRPRGRIRWRAGG
jgi:hypothetical protein